VRYLVAVDFCFLDAPGGSARVAWDIALAARDRGWTVALICMNPRPGVLPGGPVNEHGIQVVRYIKPSLPAWHPLRMQRQIAAAAEAVRRSVGVDWDLVHIHSPVTGAGVMRAAGRNPRYVYTVHSPVVREQEIVWGGQGWVGALKLRFGLRTLAALEQNLMRGCTAIHVLSEFTRREMQQFYGLPRPVSVIPHWARTEFRIPLTRAQAREALGWPVGELIFFTVRQHRERYGLDVAIEAFAELRERAGWSFYVGGDGPLRPKLQAQAAGLGLRDRIHFTGILSDRDLALAYRACDAFVLPTRALECFGLIILEAFACGAAVIATDAGAIAEIVQQITPQLIVPAGDARALSAKLRAVLDGGLNLPPAQLLMDFAAAKYGQAEVADRLIAFLQACVAEKQQLNIERHRA
jgi:glycosyltransferase involved in cell wall biosynthesis